MPKNNKQAVTLMIQGATSDAGKSILVAGLCRLFYRRGISVVPFKPQNMALNSAVTKDGGEIGRAQAVQAQACHLDAHTDMNPILLKPNSDTGAQVIIHGHAHSEMDAKTYHAYKKTAMQYVLQSHQRLAQQYDLILVEGAGSPAEINLREHDIANMGFAEAVDCPVLIVADIDKGGVFAHLYGTLKLLSATEQARVKGFIINKFRGDIALLESGNHWLEQMTNIPVLAVLPYLQKLYIEAEDAINYQCHTRVDTAKETLKVIVPVLPRISNHTDFDPLSLHPQVELLFVRQGDVIPPADLIIIPGSKSVRSDCQWLKDNGWDQAIKKHLRYDGKLLGICGGLQILGNKIHDPLGLEGCSGSSDGLGYFSYQTKLAEEKQLKQVQGCLYDDSSIHISGYEIHAGISEGLEHYTAFIQLDSDTEGVISEDKQIIASYWHGLFEQPDACDYLLKWAGLHQTRQYDHRELQEQSLDLLADTLEHCVDWSVMHSILGKHILA
jgi:adenosylcobyric acid synthase